VRVRDEGESKRPPLVCVHGAASSSVIWMDAVRRLSHQRRVVALDLPGHGQSDRWHPPPEISIDMYRDAVGTVCATLKIERAILVGHSMGALTCIAAAAAWPERVGGLVLVNCGARMPATPSLAPKLPTLVWSPATPRDVVDRWNAVAFTAEDEIAAADLAAVGRYDATPLLARVKAPTRVLAGADDLLTPPSLARDLARGIHGATVEIVAEAAHMLPQEQPDRFLAELETFLITST
jgi:pimeloyl-ACP methyl ester carboxylesterase